MSQIFVHASSGEWFANPAGAGSFRILRVHDEGRYLLFLPELPEYT